MALTTTVTIPELLQRYYDETFLETAEEEIALHQFGQKRPLPKYKGTVIQFQRYKKLPITITPLTEGTNPTEDDLEAENVEATVKEYGRFVKLSSLVQFVAMDRGLTSKVKIVGTQMAETVDILMGDEVAVNGTEQVVSTAANVAAITPTDVLTIKDIKLGVRHFKRKTIRAMKYPGGYYVLLVDPDIEFDLYADDYFVKVAQYQDATKAYKGEIGKWFGVRVVLQTQSYRTDVDGTKNRLDGVVFNNIMLGKNAFGVTELEGAAKKIIVKTPGPQDTSNPLNMYGTCGWYQCFVTKILQAKWVINLKSGATA